MAEKKEKQTFNTKLHEIPGDDKMRPVFQCIHFINGYACAADGHIAIKQTLAFQSVLSPENLDGKSLHKDSYKQIMAFDIAEATDDGIVCWNENGQKVFFEYYELKDGEKVPDFEKVINTRHGLTNLTFLGIDPKMLMRLNHAIYCPAGHTIRMQFTGINKPILIDVPGIDEQTAILMPKIINGVLF